MSVHHLEPAAALLGRLLLSAIFLHEARAKLTGYAMAIAYMQAFGVPGVLLPLAIAVELGCALLICSDFRLVLRFRRSHHFAAPSFANVGIKGALENL